MKTHIFVIFAALICISQVLAAEQKPAPWSTVFAQVSSQSDFGKSMANLVQMHIKASDPTSRLQEISDLIKSIYAQMEETENNETERIGKVRQECSTTIGSLEEQLSKANQQLVDDQREQRELRDEQSEKSGLLKEEKSNLKGMDEDLQKAQEDLKVENESFETKQADFNSLIIACESGIDLLMHMLHGEVNFGRNGKNFLQLVQVKNNFSDVLHKFKKHSSAAMIEPVLNALASLSSKTSINYDEFLQCIELLQDILARLRQDLTLLTNRHDQILNDLTTLISNLHEWIQISQNIIEIYEERLREIKTRLDELEGLIIEVNILIAALDKQLQQEKQDCQKSEDMFKEAQMKRKGEMAIMTRLIEYFDSQVAPAVGNVRDEALAL